jgi:hypothetical protein
MLTFTFEVIRLPLVMSPREEKSKDLLEGSYFEGGRSRSREKHNTGVWTLLNQMEESV